MINKLKKIALITFLSVLVLLIILGIAGFLFQDKIKGYAFNEINKQLKGELVVKGKVSFSFFKHFPKATLSFSEIILRDKNKQHPDFITAKEFALGFNTFSILKGNYNIDAIYFDDAQVHCIVYADKTTNFDVFKKSNNNNSKTSNIEIEKLIAKNVLLWIENHSSDFFLQTKINDLTGKGNLNSDSIKASVDINAELTNKASSLPQFTFEKPIHIKGDIKIGLIDNTYEFDKLKIDLAKNEAAINGKIEIEKQVDLQLKASDLAVENLIELLPNSVTQKLKGIKSKGDLNFDLQLKGAIEKHQMPDLKGSFSWKEGKLTLPNWKNDFENISLTGTFATHQQQLNCNIEKCNAILLDHPFSLQLTCFSSPEKTAIKATTTGNFNVKDLLTFLKTKPNDAKGEIALQNFQTDFSIVNDKLENFSSNNIIQLNEVDVLFDDWQLENMQGKISLQNNFLSTDSLQLKLNGNLLNCALQFSLNNIFTSTKSLSSLTVLADAININSLLKSTSSKNDTTAQWLEFPLQIQLQCNKMQWNKLLLNNVKAFINITDSLLNINRFFTNTQNGNFDATGVLVKTLQNIPFTFSINFNQLNIASTFQQFDNFGQQLITAEKIKGDLTGKINVHGIFDKSFKVNLPSITALTDFEITNGELNNVTQLMSLSKYIKVKDLEHLKFATLKDEIEINNSKIIIPEMMIRSNAINVNIAGTHTFDNDIDYLIKVSMLDVLARKLGKSTDENWSADDNKKGFNIFLRMTGNVSNPKISLNKKANRTLFKEQLKTEQQTMKKLINAELKGELPQEQPVDFKSNAPPTLIEWDDTTK